VQYSSVLLSGSGGVAGIQPLGGRGQGNSNSNSNSINREVYFLCEDCDGCEPGCHHEDHSLRLLPGSLQLHQLNTGKPISLLYIRSVLNRILPKNLLKFF
jgi:hypothetical protein